MYGQKSIGMKETAVSKCSVHIHVLHAPSPASGSVSKICEGLHAQAPLADTGTHFAAVAPML
eukprot:3588688-Prymnesium_polylepis.1